MPAVDFTAEAQRRRGSQRKIKRLVRRARRDTGFVASLRSSAPLRLCVKGHSPDPCASPVYDAATFDSVAAAQHECDGLGVDAMLLSEDTGGERFDGVVVMHR